MAQAPDGLSKAARNVGGANPCRPIQRRPQVRAGFARRSAQGEFRTVAHSPGAAGERYTTAAMLRMEREAIQRMQEGNRVALGNEP